MPLLDDYFTPGSVPQINTELDPEQLKRAQAMALMRLGFGMAGRENIGSAMQGGINTMLSGQEEARRQAATQAQLALQQYKAQEQYREAMKKASFIKNMDVNTLRAAGIPDVLIESVKNAENPAEATLKFIDFYKPQTTKPGDIQRDWTGAMRWQNPQATGEQFEFDQEGRVRGMTMTPGSLEVAAAKAGATAGAEQEARERAKARYELTEVPVPKTAPGYVPGQTETMTKEQRIRELSGAQPQPGSWVIPPAVQTERDQRRMALLNDELRNAVAQGNKTEIAAISKEIDIINKKNVGGATLVATNRRVKDPVAQREAEAKIPSTPEGYRWTDKGLEQVPGGPKDTSEQEKLKITNAVNRADLVMKKVGEVKGAVDWTTVGPASSLIGWVPGTSQYDLKKNVEMLKANIGFQELAAMRAASPTGGALGQVALQELDMLQSTLGSLDTSQSPSEMKKNLDNVMTHFNNWKSTMEQSGEKFSPPKSPKPQEVSIDDLVNKYRK